MFALAVSTLRARKGAFVGAFVALLCAAALVTACAALLETGLRGKIPTERYAGTSMLVTADQNVHFTKEKKGKTKTKSKPLTERAWLDASLTDRLSRVDGVRSVVPELTFPAQVLAPGTASAATFWGHAWESARLTPSPCARDTHPAPERSSSTPPSPGPPGPASATRSPYSPPARPPRTASPESPPPRAATRWTASPPSSSPPPRPATSPRTPAASPPSAC